MAEIRNKYGYLSEDAREFIITDPETPRPWFNYAWNELYGALISHTGGGFSFLECPRDNRISRMRYNSLPWDRPGRYIIIKDIERNEYWSLSWAPTPDRKYAFYECRIGQGYTTIITEYADIRAELTYFVPRNDTCEIWKVKLYNKAEKERKLEVYAFQELMMGNALNDIINQPNDKHFTEVHFNKENHALEASRRYWVLNKKSATVEQPNREWPYTIYFTGSLPVSGFDGGLDQFTGKWRSESNPIAIEESQMRNSEITAGDPVVALQSEISIDTHGSQEFAFQLGICSKRVKNPYDYLKIQEYKKIPFVEEKLQEVKTYWDEYLNHVHVKTPDKSFNAMLNVWNSYQSAVTFDMARNAGYYHGGLLFGTGMRDQFQDILGMVVVHPQRVRKRILNALQYQFKDGSCLHNFFKLTQEGERTHHSDTPLWIPFGIVEYLNETADFSILEELVKYNDEGEATVYEHMKRAIYYAINETTVRGFPKIRKGDWNDTLDHVGPKGKGETIWGAFFLAYILQKVFELLDHRKDVETKNQWLQVYHNLKKQLNDIAWDGEWFIRAFNDNLEPVGSHKSTQGKLFLNAQSWSVISGIASEEKAEQAIQNCLHVLENKTGMQICWPAYRKVEESTGLISRCVPGKKENAAVFNHASAWFVLAAILNGKIEEAYRIYAKMMPFNSSRIIGIDRYETEPYVYSEYVTSKEHDSQGQASHSWLTGSSVWMYRIGLDYILGLRTSLKGIHIEPHVPSLWRKFKVHRKFRNKTLKIEYLNSKGYNRGIFALKVNGKKYEEGFIDVSQFAEETIHIEVRIS